MTCTCLPISPCSGCRSRGPTRAPRSSSRGWNSTRASRATPTPGNPRVRIGWCGCGRTGRRSSPRSSRSAGTAGTGARPGTGMSRRRAPPGRPAQGFSSRLRRWRTGRRSPNLLIKYSQKLSPGTVDAIRERMTARYATPQNAFKTLVLDQGADATVIGNSLAQMDFSNVMQAGSDRILAASSVPGVLVGLEPLRGAGRGYQESVQKFANMWARPSWQQACQVLSKFVPGLPGGAQLWYDTANIQLLQDGEMERAQAALVRAQALLAHVQAGYDRESAVKAVNSGDVTQLKTAAVPVAAPAGNVQHLLPQTSPGAVASPLPPSVPRLQAGSVSPGDGGNETRPVGRPAAARRALNGAGNG